MSMAADDDGGMSALHDSSVDVPVLVALSTAGDRNTVRAALLPVACWRMDDVRFDFDSSFIVPAARKEIGLLVALIEQHPGCPAAIFGHADPTGNDDYNKALSGRRARAIYGLVTRDPAQWETLWSQKTTGDDWGTRSLQIMLGSVPSGSGAPYYTGPSDGVNRSEYVAAVKAFQADRGLAVDGVAGPQTRAALFVAYMDFLTGRPEPGFAMPRTDFLGGGGDPAGRGAFQGCSEFNPVLVFSAEDQRRLERAENHEERNERNAINRRVVLYLFPPGAKIDLAKWPCPAATEGTAKCKKMFWPDGDQRRAPAAAERRYPATRDTMACRFYEGMSRRSPCEGVSSVRTVTLTLHDRIGNVLPGAPFRITGDDGTRSEGTADATGIARWRGKTRPTTLRVEWSRPRTAPDVAQGAPDPKTGRFELEHVYWADFREGDRNTTVSKRLANLGYYSAETLADNVRIYQVDRKLEETGSVEHVEPKVRVEHDRPEVQSTAGEPGELDGAGGPPPIEPGGPAATDDPAPADEAPTLFAGPPPPDPGTSDDTDQELA
jgi:hypothetical protein